MAKIKGYDPPETEFAYDDATGDRHYFGEFLRMAMGAGSISPRDPETDIIGKSRRGERPSQQGKGTDPQAYYREIFKNCAKMWSALSEDCPPTECVGLPPGVTSKKAVWDAKLEHGVVCSYYDLFVRCCILFAAAHSGEMPTDECFPCQAIEPGMSWDYETSEEEIDREASAEIAITGLNGPFIWEVSGVGFTLEHAITGGLTNTLHADETACGAAGILVVGCDDKNTTGYVRCSTGQWALKGNYCGMPGAKGEVYDVSFGSFKVVAIQGNQKQYFWYTHYGWGTVYGSWYENQEDAQEACQALIALRCENEADCLDFDPPCEVAGDPNWKIACSCEHDNICRGGCGLQYKSGPPEEWRPNFGVLSFYDPTGARRQYFEWVC